MLRVESVPTLNLFDADDPLSMAIKPPPSESALEREARINAELEAKRISDLIDQEIKLGAKQRPNTEVKLLLLGQAESGKSTLQKQFQIFYAPASLDEERDSWRSVVYFNILRNIKRILQALDALELGTDGSPSLQSSGPDVSMRDISPEPDLDTVAFAGPSRTHDGTPGAADHSDVLSVPLSPPARTQLANLKLRLSPLVSAESALADRLSGGMQLNASAKRRGGGVYVRSGWQSNVRINGRKRRADDGHGKAAVSEAANLRNQLEEELDKVGRMLDACKGDIKQLWTHPFIKLLIDKRKLRLQESADHFFNGIDRVTNHDYTPSTDDILRSRLQTMGIASHSFSVTVNGKPILWHLYDVGGARGLRHTWVPYFDDANAIIFLAPISAFDQYLDEDPKMNRINDSLQLFTYICSNELLKRVHLVLFLNKTDVLREKLAAGVPVKRYIPSFGDRKNNYDTVIEYFRTHFLQVHRKNNEEQRVLYTHLTNVVDTKTTQGIIRNVRDSIFRGYLQEASLV